MFHRHVPPPRAARHSLLGCWLSGRRALLASHSHDRRHAQAPVQGSREAGQGRAGTCLPDQRACRVRV